MSDKTLNKGKFIVIEGLEGAGKSSAIKVIEQVLNENGISFIKTREPGGTLLAEQLRTIVKSSDHREQLTEETELLLMYASRSQLLANVIHPALDEGKWVIGDRHDLSSRAYQGGGRQFNNNVMDAIANVTLKGFTPDLTLYLDLDPVIGLSRAEERGELDRIEVEKIDFFERVRAKYLEYANNDERILTIDAAQEMDKVHQDIYSAISNYLASE